MNTPTKVPAEHNHVSHLLPWYVNNTLSKAELAQVKQHLERCTACRSELEQCRNLSRHIQHQWEAQWQPSANHFAQLLKTIDNEAGSAAQAEPVTTATSRGSWWDRFQGWGAELVRASPPVRWTLAAQGALAVLLAVSLFAADRPAQTYTTLSTPQSPTTSQAALQLVVDENMPEKTLRELLLRIDGRIVDGPSRHGIYTVALAKPDQMAAALAVLRGEKQVRLAEPLGNTSR